jgi:hypothetical protein
MAAQSSIHFYLNWAKERIDEMDAILASLEGKASDVQSASRVKANQLISDLRRKRDAFRDTAAKQAEAGDAAWARTKTQLEAEWAGFENEVGNYIENFGRQAEQQQATFQLLIAAQMKSWREMADKVRDATQEFAPERRSELGATVTRMKADAAAAEEKLQKLAQAGTAPWSTLNTALTETRAAFDRANHFARDAFK